jgi:hypothetical protein
MLSNDFAVFIIFTFLMTFCLIMLVSLYFADKNSQKWTTEFRSNAENARRHYMIAK